jgi:hypothetical protein
LITFAKNRAAKQIRFRNDELDEFIVRRQRFGKALLFVNGVPRIQKRRNRIVAENDFDLFIGQRLFSVIAFAELGNVGQVAQETPGVAASCSGAFVKE